MLIPSNEELKIFNWQSRGELFERILFSSIDDAVK